MGHDIVRESTITAPQFTHPPPYRRQVVKSQIGEAILGRWHWGGGIGVWGGGTGEVVLRRSFQLATVE